VRQVRSLNRNTNMKSTLKSTLSQVMSRWLEDQDNHDDRPPGIACPQLDEMMTDAAAAVYDASHAGAVAGTLDASLISKR